MNVRQKILVKYLSKYILVRIEIPSLVEIQSWPGRRELPITLPFQQGKRAVGLVMELPENS